MNKIISKILIFSFSIFLTTIVYAQSAGKVLFVYGDATIVKGKQVAKADKGMPIESGDLINTGKNSTLQLKLSDGTLVALRPETSWNLKEYLYERENPSLGKQSSELIKGGLRAVTGYIGKANPKNVEYTTSTVTIGIRGTTFEMINNLDGTNRGIFVRVETGKVEVSNKLGSMVVYPNQVAGVIDNQAPLEVEAKDIFKSVDELIENRSNQSKSNTKLILKQNSDELNILTSKNASLNNSKDYDVANLNDDIVNQDVKLKVANSLDNLDLSLAYYKIVFSLAGEMGDVLSYNSNLSKVKSLNLGSKSTKDFFKSKNNFVGKGYEELKQAYENLPNSEKQKLANLYAIQNGQNNKVLLYQNLKDSFKLNATKVKFNSNSLVFEKYRENSSDEQGLSQQESFVKPTISSDFIIPNQVYDYAYSLSSSNNEIVIKDSNSNEAEIKSLDLKVDFANKKFLNAEFKYNFDVSSKKYIFTYSKIKEDSYLLDSGIFYLSFEKLVIENSTNLSENGSFRNLGNNQFGLAGNFWQSSANKPKLHAVFGAYVDLTNSVIGANFNNEIKHIGYVEFK